MRALGFVVVLASAIVWSSCNCGGAAGAPCTQGSDCLSGTCGADAGCTAPPGSGDGGSTGTLPDGGACENLQCQVQACAGGGTTSISGKVYDPAGNVPLYNAVVLVPNKPVAAFPSGPTCAACGALISGAPVAIAITGPDGSFTLTGVPSGSNIPLVIQVGKWRRQVTLPSVTSCQDNPLTDASITRLPRDRSEGDLPQMALSSGNADAFECLLRKIGISDSEVTAPSGGGRVHFYKQNGMDLSAGGAPPGKDLWTDAGTLMNYDVVMLPCEGGAHNKPAAAVQNLVSYANAGGRVFATHYSYVWTRPGWPQAAQWQPGLADLYDSTFTVTVDQSFPKGQAFAQWLTNVGASTSPGSLDLIESRHDVVSVNVGATRWLYGDIPASNPTGSIQHLTFNTPYLDAGVAIEGGDLQCGRVVFSDFHVTAGATDGGAGYPDSCVGSPLTAQEKALEFMFFDLSACVQDDHTAPTACAAAGQACDAKTGCCTGLECDDPAGNACTATATGCTCQASFN